MKHILVWLISTDLPEPVLAGLARLLDASERERAASLLRADHCRRFVAAHGAVRVILGRYLGMPPAQLCWRQGPHGKPELAGARGEVQLSLSHSGPLAALAVTSGRRVGVDIQQVPRDLDATGLSARFYPAADARLVAAASGPARQADRFIWLWARKEACVKVTGGRLLPGLARPAHGRGNVIIRDPRGSYLVTDVLVPRGFRAAVAAEGTLPYRVTRRWWPDQAGGLAGTSLPISRAPSSKRWRPPPRPASSRR
jgi:4'-phosphopantetheinyl transferase